jgi:hypothetical protein
VSKQETDLEDAARLVLVSAGATECIAWRDRGGSDEGYVSAQKEPLMLIRRGCR